MEVEKFASRGVANTALGLSIGSLGAQLLTGGLSNIFGGNCGSSCSENTVVSRFELEQEQKISKLESEIALRDANTYTMGEMGKLRDYVDGKFARIEHEICDQKVFNATTMSTVSCLSGQVNSMQALLGSITKTVVPNGAICPGWGDVTVSITPTTTTTTGA